MTPEGFKRKLAAILSADVKGYCRLMGEDEILQKTRTSVRAGDPGARIHGQAQRGSIRGYHAVREERVPVVDGLSGVLPCGTCCHLPPLGKGGDYG